MKTIDKIKNKQINLLINRESKESETLDEFESDLNYKVVRINGSDIGDDYESLKTLLLEFENENSIFDLLDNSKKEKVVLVDNVDHLGDSQKIIRSMMNNVSIGKNGDFSKVSKFVMTYKEHDNVERGIVSRCVDF